MAKHNELGKIGEEQAQAYLLQKGYQIRHINWKTGKLELDIVAVKNKRLVVVEVKTRSTETFEHPEEAITLKKMRNIVRAAQAYIFHYDWQGETQFDVISVIPVKKSFKIVHIEDAFLPPLG